MSDDSEPFNDPVVRFPVRGPRRQLFEHGRSKVRRIESAGVVRQPFVHGRTKACPVEAGNVRRPFTSVQRSLSGAPEGPASVAGLRWHDGVLWVVLAYRNGNGRRMVAFADYHSISS